jgi:lysozyme
MNTEEFIEGHEGRRNKPYKDNAVPPKKTIGVGWNMDAHPLPPVMQNYLKQNGEITDAMVDQLLEISIEAATSDCESLFPDFDNFSDDRKMALIDFVFQLGLTKAGKFVHAVAAINTGRWADAAAEMMNSEWAKQVPSRAEEVTDLVENG